jgi:hypothetical protein
MNKKQILEAKLKLWNMPEFKQFIEDLSNYYEPEINIKLGSIVMKNLYKNELEKLHDKNQFKQGELPL